MTSLDHGLTPKMKPVHQRRSALVAALDIGTSKVACLIARMRPCLPSDTLRGRSHAIDVIGVSLIQSRGMKAGAVVDLAAAEQAVRQAVSLAERMAGVQLESVLEACADIRSGSVTSDDVSRLMSAGTYHSLGEGRTVIHALPVGFSLDGAKGVRDPKGMVARQLGVDMNVVTTEAAVAKNLMLAVQRCHLNVEAMVAAPYVAGLGVLTDDEADLGAAVIEMGAGTTSIAIHSGGHLVHASGFAVGGHHVTMDLARGLGACVADAERIKTLYATVLTGGSDARELVTIPSAGDQERESPQIVSRGTISNIVRERVEEIFEMVRDRLADSPFASEPRARIVLTGGGSQLAGVPELASQMLGRQVRIGRPLGFGKLPAEAKAAAFAVPAGLLVYPQYAHLEHVEPRSTRQLRTGTGYFGKVGRWLREGF
jgi:cell division protein FtsA